MARIHQTFCKTSLGDKEGNLDKWRLKENSKFWAKKLNSNKMTKEAASQMAVLRKLQIWQEFIDLTKIKTR